MKTAFATLAFFTLFTFTAGQSPIVTTSTSLELSDDMQTDDMSEISVPENDDLTSTFDDVSDSTYESGVQTGSTSEAYSALPPTPTDPASSSAAEAPTAVDSTTTGDAATLPPVSDSTSSSVAESPTTTPVVQPTASSSDVGSTVDPAVSATPPPSAASTEEGTAADTTTDDESAATVAPEDLTTESSATSAPTVASTNSQDEEEEEEEEEEEGGLNTASGATGLWVNSWSTASTAAVGFLGAIALRSGVFSGEL